MTPSEPTAARRVADAIVEDILTGVLPPESALREDELSARFGVSRHTLRTALAETNRRRLTSAEPYRGHRVVAFGPQQVTGLQQLRCALEGEAVRLIGSRPIPTAIAGLDELRAVAARTPDDWVAVARAHFRLHLGLVRDAGCDRLSEAYRDLEDEVLLLVGHLRSRDETDLPVAEHAVLLVTEHADYLDTIRARGPVAVREHMDNSRRLLVDRDRR